MAILVSLPFQKKVSQERLSQRIVSLFVILFLPAKHYRWHCPKGLLLDGGPKILLGGIIKKLAHFSPARSCDRELVEQSKPRECRHQKKIGPKSSIAGRSQEQQQQKADVCISFSLLGSVAIVRLSHTHIQNNKQSLKTDDENAARVKNTLNLKERLLLLRLLNVGHFTNLS